LEELQITIRGRDERSLGDIEDVRAALDALFPGIAWEWSSTGADRLAAAEASGLELPPAVRRVMESQRSVLCGEVHTGGLTGTFNFGPGAAVPTVWATLGGDRVTVDAALSRLRGRRDWSIGPGEGWLITDAE
jgi:hypothetical protein